MVKFNWKVQLQVIDEVFNTTATGIQLFRTEVKPLVVIMIFCYGILSFYNPVMMCYLLKLDLFNFFAQLEFRTWPKC